jgi:hypothetical protein
MIKISGFKKFLPFFVIISMLFLMVCPNPAFAEGEGPVEEPAQGEIVADEAPADEVPADEVVIEEQTAVEEVSEAVSDEGKAVHEEENTELEVAAEETTDAAAEELVVEETTGEPAAEEPVVEEEVIAEIVTAVAKNDLVLADDSGVPLDMASQETADLLSEVDDPWYVYGGETYGFSSTGTCVSGVTICESDLLNPIQAAIDDAPGGSTIYIKTYDYVTTTVNVNKVVTLKGVQGATTSDLTAADVFINTVNLSVNISGWDHIFATSVNVRNDTAEIQEM